MNDAKHVATWQLVPHAHFHLQALKVSGCVSKAHVKFLSNKKGYFWNWHQYNVSSGLPVTCKGTTPINGKE